MRPRLLDLGCKAGGASTGYARAGFDVTGVDLEPQPHYPFEFIQGDMLTFPFDGFDAIHASPPCQHHANVTAWRGSRDDHPDVLTPFLARLENITVPWVVENVPEALPTWDYVLCGSQFGLSVRRHRGFRRGNWAAFELMPPCQHVRLLPFMHKGERAYADAMGCQWMTKEEARQAIPPAFTEYVGRLLLGFLSPALAAVTSRSP
jgi:SAM-dependent methyltransferase